MRDYAKISPQFWSGSTGRLIATTGREAQLVACYLITGTMARAIGLYYLPLVMICEEVNISQEGARKALRSLSEAHFAYYDEPSRYAWVPEMARFQYGEPLDPRDKRVAGIRHELQGLRNAPFFNDFLRRYASSYHLHDISPIEAPSEPHRSQEQEKEQEKEQEQEQEIHPPASTAGVTVSPNGQGADAFDRFWTVYPRKKGKGAALRAWHHLKPPLEVVLAAVEAQRRSPDWQREGGRFIPHPATWLNQTRWQDEPDPPLLRGRAALNDPWAGQQTGEVAL